jgi:site-specific DNA-cytosine methylase
MLLSYQVRYGILQAAHYGAPQIRVRFFMVAAKHGYALPDLPTPTHDFPVSDALEIKLPVGHHIRPIWTRNGYAPHQFVTIDDAISDLPRFDWYSRTTLYCAVFTHYRLQGKPETANRSYQTPGRTEARSDDPT